MMTKTHYGVRCRIILYVDDVIILREVYKQYNNSPVDTISNNSKEYTNMLPGDESTTEMAATPTAVTAAVPQERSVLTKLILELMDLAAAYYDMDEEEPTAELPPDLADIELDPLQ